jgi:hypothetical protein
LRMRRRWFGRENTPKLHQLIYLGVSLSAYGRYAESFLFKAPVSLAEWRFQRKIASHIFSSRNLRDCMSTSFSKHGVELLERIERVSAVCAKGGGIGAKGAYFDMQDMFYRFTFDSIGEIAFGVSVGCLKKVCECICIS